MDQIRADAHKIVTNSQDFGEEITFTTAGLDPITVSVFGLQTKHHLQIDHDGTPVNSRTASIAISEKSLVDLGYPVRNGIGEVWFQKHKVLCKDSTGTERSYIVKQWFPDEEIGLIVIILDAHA